MSEISHEALDWLESIIDRKIQNALANSPKNQYKGRVLSQDKEGVVWVEVPGVADRLPADITLVEVNNDDIVQVTIDDGAAIVDGNQSSPSVNRTTAESVAKGVVAPVNIAIENIVASHAQFELVQAQYAEIVNATIQELQANKADIDFANITWADIDQAFINAMDANYAHLTNGVIDNAKIDYADVEDLDANYAHITDGVIDNAKIDYADVEDLDSNYAHITNGVIDNASIGYASVNGLAANYAQIDFQNVISQQAAYAVVQSLLTTSGWFETTQVGQETVHYLTAVHIDANDVDIEHLKVRDLYLFDDTQGTEGVWYQLNVTAGGITYSDLTPQMQAEVKAGLHGDNIIAATVTADKIYVQDLSAFNATIAGMVFDTVTIGGTDYYSMHTFGKTAVNSNTPGMYTDSMGQFSVGTASDYLMFYKDAQGNWKLAISAELITMGGSTLASQIQTLQSQIDNVVETWFGEGAPTLSNYPASSWTTGAIKNVHLGDVYYDNDTGRAYRFALSSTSTPNNPVYEWVQIPDSAVAAVMESVNGLSGDVSTLATMAANTLIYDHTYEFVTSDGTVQGETQGEDVAVFTAHLYRGGEDIAASMTTSEQQQFTWYLRNEGEVTGTLIGQGLTLRVRLAEMGYGSHIVGRYTTVEEAELLTEEDDNLTTSDDDDLIARTPSGGSVRVSDLSVATVVNGTDKLMVVGAEDEHLVTIDTLKGVFGTPSYTNITDKPSIEGVTLVGNKDFPDLGIFLDADLPATGQSGQYPASDGYAMDNADILAIFNMAMAS